VRNSSRVSLSSAENVVRRWSCDTSSKSAAPPGSRRGAVGQLRGDRVVAGPEQPLREQLLAGEPELPRREFGVVEQHRADGPVGSCRSPRASWAHGVGGGAPACSTSAAPIGCPPSWEGWSGDRCSEMARAGQRSRASAAAPASAAHPVTGSDFPSSPRLKTSGAIAEHCPTPRQASRSISTRITGRPAPRSRPSPGPSAPPAPPARSRWTSRTASRPRPCPGASSRRWRAVRGAVRGRSADGGAVA